MTVPVDLLELLPPAYRVADRGDGQLLRLLADALAGPHTTLSIAADALYDEWFIETCSPRAIGLIGEMVGVDTDSEVAALLPSWRRYVANAAAYRRSKGRLDTLACAAAAATGWAALARLDADITAIEDDAQSALGRAGAARSPAFERSARMLAVAPPGPEAEAITLFLWRCHVYPLRRLGVTPRGHGRFVADPLDVERPMYRLPRTTPGAVHPIAEADLPLPLTVAMLADVLAKPPAAGPLGPGAELPVAVHVNGCTLAPHALVAADLADWRVNWPDGARVAIDPERGRLLAHPALDVRSISVDRSYAAPADIGGGPYRVDADPGSVTVTRIAGGGDALSRLFGGHVDHAATIEIDDSLAYYGDVTIGVAAPLTLRARAGETPCIVGDVHLRGAKAPVVIDGLWIAGILRIEGAMAVELRDCTVRGGVERRCQGDGEIRFTRCIVSGLQDIADGAVSMIDSLADGPVAVAGPLASERSTFLASVVVGTVTASNSVFAAPLSATDTMRGEVTHSYVAPRSTTPRRVDCVGDDADRTIMPPRPMFVSKVYGTPGFGQLDERTDAAIATGASNGWEMGCFNGVAAPLRHAALDQAISAHAPWRWNVRRVVVA